jgi:hypothetical protein
MAQIVKRTLGDGKTVHYYVRTRIGGRVVTRTFKRQKDADNYANTTEADKLRGVAVDPRSGRLVVEELVNRWLAANPAKRSSTMTRDRSAASLYVVPAIGSRAINSVTCPLRRLHRRRPCDDTRDCGWHRAGSGA